MPNLKVPENAHPSQYPHATRVIDRPFHREHDVEALRALARGTATADQQKHALDYIIYTMCETYGNNYRADDRDTYVAIGKELVGQNLIYLLQNVQVSTNTTQQSVREHFANLDKSDADKLIEAEENRNVYR